MKLEDYHATLRQVEVALKELGKAEGMFGDVEGKYQEHPLAASFLKLEENVHVLTHENGSTIAFQLADVQRQLSRLEIMLDFPAFSEIEFETIEREQWSLELVKKLHASANERNKVSLEQVSSDIKKLQKRLPKP